MTLSDRDRLDIADLVARYALYTDRRRWPQLLELFAADAELVLPDPPAHLGPMHRLAARDGIRRAATALAEVPVTQHAVLGHVIDEAGAGRASGTVTGSAQHVSDGPDGTGHNLVWHLHYDDVYRRDEGCWRFERRELQIDWIETRAVRRRRAGNAPEASR